MEEELNVILKSLLDTDNDQRSSGESAFWDMTQKDPPSVIQILFHIIETTDNNTRQMLALILLKLIFAPFKQEIFDLIPLEIHTFIQEKLLYLFSSNIFPEINLNYLSTAVATIASVYISLNEYQNFIPSLFQIILNSTPQLRAPAIDCAVQVITNFKNNLELDQNQTFQIITMVLQDNSIPSASVAVMRFLYTIIPDGEIPPEYQELASVIVPLISQLEKDLLSSMLLNLAIFIAKKPKFVIPILDSLVQIVLSIATDQNQDEGARINAIEVISQICIRISEENNYLQHVIESMFMIITETDETHYPPYEDETNISDIAQQYLLSIGSVQNLQPLFTQIVLQIISNNIESSEWNIRYASLKSLESLIISSHNFIEEKSDIVSLLVLQFQDSFAVCRVAAFVAFSQAVLYFKDSVKFSDLIENFITTIENETIEKALIAEIFSLSLLCEKSSVDDLRSSCETMIPIFINLSENANPMRMNAILRCISSYLRSLRNEMGDYYSILIEYLRNIIEIENSENDINVSLLRARAIECFGYLLSCIPHDIFFNEADWFVSKVIGIDWNIFSEDELIQIQTTLSRIVVISLGLDKAEYVGPVVEKLLEAVQNRPKFAKHQQFDPFMKNISREKINFLLDSIFMEVPNDQLQVYESALSNLKYIMKNSGQLFVQYILRFCKAAAPACFYFPLPQTQIIALQCLRESSSVYTRYSSVSNSLAFILHMNRTLFWMFDQLELKPPVLIEVFKTLAFSLQTLIRIKYSDDDETVNEIIEHIPSALNAIMQSAEQNGNCSEMENGLTDVLLLLFQHFPQKMSSYFIDNLSNLLPMDSNSPSILSLNCWTAMLRIEENQTSEKVTEVFNYIVSCIENNNIHDYMIISSAFFCMGTLIDMEVLEEEKINLIISISFSSLDNFEQIENGKEVIDGIIYLLTCIINVYDENCSQEMIFRWYTHLPFTTPIIKSRSVYLTLADQLSHDYLNVFKCANPERINEDPHNDPMILLQGIQKFVEILIKTFRSELIDMEIDQRFKGIYTDIANDPLTGPVLSMIVSQLDQEYRDLIQNYHLS
ncbi:hypothetical protein TVAG_250580 [Trichomonas vaginalis G3]|uniref:Importin N-terminal domain-containing protein n=1 Tax=Trichomonas vaginalis (strain ATCC PRA-98 / G3) TaxID=412133 RepID=A2ESQ7_TRIV3|nr:ribosomal protein import into nucleus [Trichomonas vaginalis G3]EAY04298.1 hypothetical protein TVAG_250580 [Trichomonas vaginalis G3]KAI5498259.1 ribosomal protein import into nucleus [Trichomonas vaginalis G3]|eukprot:XP_001316521.1 hypothetical protein [Trichomonas vaginalis G3]